MLTISYDLSVLSENRILCILLNLIICLSSFQLDQCAMREVMIPHRKRSIFTVRIRLII